MSSTFSFPTITHYGAGILDQLPDDLSGLKIRHPLVVTDPGLVATDAFKLFRSIKGAVSWPVFSKVQPNPTEDDVERASAAFTQLKCDGVIAIGGGSALDVGKVIRLRIRRPEMKLGQFDFHADWSGLVPFIAIPTTAGTGSEVGRSSVIILEGKKAVLFHPKLLADRVYLDPRLTTGLPPKLTAATGADALTHCIESFTSPVFHPLCEGIALEGIRLINRSLTVAVQKPDDLTARGEMQLAAMMGGIAFQKDLGATHSLAHPLSSICGIHHGLANALCLPAVMRLNATRKPGVYQRIASAFELPDTSDRSVIGRVETLLGAIGITPGLKKVGVREDQVQALTEQAFLDGCHQTNAVPVTKQDLRDLYMECL
jgi:alcohol dehydrogenase class IV